MIETVLWNGERLEEASQAIGTGLEREPVTLRYATIDAELRRLGPSILVIGDRLLVVARSTRTHAHALAPAGGTVRVPLATLREVLCARVESRIAADVDSVLVASGVTGARATRSRTAMLRELVGDAPIGELWILRPPVEDVRASVRESRILFSTVAFASASIAQTLLLVASWWILGIMAFHVGSIDTLLALWGMVVLTMVPLRAAELAAARAAVREAGALLKRRLLLGALKLTPDEVHGKGAGTHLGHILEAGAVEGLAGGGAITAVTSVITAVMALVVLARGAGGVAHAMLFATFVAAMVTLTIVYARARGAWTEARFSLTGHVVENMIGHKTRLAQRASDARNDGEDQRLARYVALEVLLNRSAIAMDVLRRAWPWVGLFTLAPGVVLGRGDAARVAIGAGGVLLGATALTRWTDASAQIAAAFIAWRRIQPFWQAASRTAPAGSAALECVLDERSAMPLLHVASVTYRHRHRDVAAVEDAELVVRSGDRVLLGGPSGSGKSTLAAILSGVRPMQAGLLFFRGLDLGTVGVENWRRRVLLVPQFHENHVFVGTLAYNLLLGRGWPASPADLDEARAVCRGVGLGPLLARMPLGLQQPVGETGWQLSHGECTRVFLARAILQKPAVTILDETFAALDPSTLAVSIQFAREHADALIVIAHTE